ncbi:MAG: peptidoglycan bridge formation glycyltransferase FemA/FemB family protein [Chloroflexota bacterium]|nr:peptidoglycan bridge formation glycyltransferase FemA/FemB family protein [Chloroflexota bacterium]MDE2911028.1 peptidoglycan bridge formation glycyltransferase FemA/FemB family protein [Chloroflexota bacterium]
MSASDAKNIAGIERIHPTDADWDRFVCGQPRAHLLQLSAWGALKSQFGWDARIVALGIGAEIQAGALVLSKFLPFGLGKMAYVPLGGYAIDPLLYPLLWDLVGRETGAAFIKLEPGHFPPGAAPDFARMGFRKSPQTIQPPRTIVIDIAADDETILRRMNQGTRRKIRKSLKSGINFEEGARVDLSAFSQLMAHTGQRNAFGVHNEAYFAGVFELLLPKYGTLLLARREGDLLAAIMVFGLGETAWYLYGASARGKGNLYATYGIQWAAIQWAKQRGCRYYDLWGVPDHDEATLEAQFKDRGDGLWGVYGFKRGWGGEVRRSLGAWDKALNPLVYAAYRAAIKLSG